MQSLPAGVGELCHAGLPGLSSLPASRPELHHGPPARLLQRDALNLLQVVEAAAAAYRQLVGGVAFIQFVVQIDGQHVQPYLQTCWKFLVLWEGHVHEAGRAWLWQGVFWTQRLQCAEQVS